MNRIAALAACLLLATPAARAQDKASPPSPAQVQEMMDATFNTMVPVMARMVEATLQSQLQVLARPDSAAQMATYVRNFYSELVKQGFTEAQALQIASSLAVPSAASPMR